MTQDLLRATLDRLDEIETALNRLYKPPFLAIDEHDKPQKELAQLLRKIRCRMPVEADTHEPPMASLIT